MVSVLAFPVQTVAVIGAGIMGRGIAQGTALGGYRTILEDLLPNALRKAKDEFRDTLYQAVEMEEATAEAANAALARLECADSVEDAAREADFIIEAVPDELESKLEIFTLLDKICRPQTMLTSNTSLLSITEIASVTYRPNKCVGMRFVIPVHKMKQLEVVGARDTDEQTIAAAVEVGRRMGKQVLVVQDSQISSPTSSTL